MAPGKKQKVSRPRKGDGSLELRLSLEPERTLRFGSVTVKAGKAVASEVSMNVKQGQRALGRAREVLATPGVSLGLASDVPRFHADSKGRLVRVLNGRRDVVALVKGKFKVVR